MATPKPRILVVLDPAELNDTLFEHTARLARQLDAQIELFAVTYTPYFFGKRSRESREARAVKAHYVVEQKRRLDEVAKKHFSKEHVIKTDVYWDLPEYEAIIRKILHSSPIMVVRNSEYGTVIDRALLSNDDWNLIRNCPIPVLLIRGASGRPLKGAIWAAVDPMHEHDKPSSLDDEIIAQAKFLAQASNSHVHLVHTYDSSDAITIATTNALVAETVSTREIHERIRDEHLAGVMALANKHQIPADRVHNELGKAKVVLPALIKEHAPDMLVMGAVSRSFFKRLIIGNTAEKILDKISCDLCVVKSKEFVSPITANSEHEKWFRNASV